MLILCQEKSYIIVYFACLAYAYTSPMYNSTCYIYFLSCFTCYSYFRAKTTTTRVLSEFSCFYAFFNVYDDDDNDDLCFSLYFECLLVFNLKMFDPISSSSHS